MKPLDLAYLEKCIKLVEIQVGFGEIQTWKQRNYEKLSELIAEKTNVSLSLSTVKRILNKDINQLPQKATLDALAQFTGHTDWFGFIKQSPEITDQFNGNGDKIHRHVAINSNGMKRKSIFIISLAVMVLLFTAYFFVRKHYFSEIPNNTDTLKDTSGLLINVDTLSGKKFAGLALTPPMGWNSYNSFGIKIDEKLIRDIADKMAESGMRDAGYRYLIIDEGWPSASRDKLGNLVADSIKFPGGIKALADYVHSKGLKFGIYCCSGYKSWYGKPGARGHEFQDAKLFASWGVDYIKYDWSWTLDTVVNAIETYKIMRDAIYASQRPMIFSICEQGQHQPWRWGKNVGHLWRTTPDISDCFDCKGPYSTGWKSILDKQAGLEKYSGPGHWNDPDMLEVGNPGLSLKESKAHFSAWCMLAAPLIAGNDLRKMPEEIRQILTNKEAIALDQNSLGKQATRYSCKDGKEIWIKELSGGNWVFCFLNTSKSMMKMQIDWHDFTMLNGIYNIRDIWKSEYTGTTQEPLNIEIKSNEVLLLKLLKRSRD